MSDTDREGYVTLARVGHAFAVVRAARALGERSCYRIPEKASFTVGEWEAMKCHECPACLLNDALTDLDALDPANHREHSDG